LAIIKLYAFKFSNKSITVFCLIFITLGGFKGVDYIPKFVYMGILASEGFMMLDRFLIVPYRLAGPIEWIAVVIIAIFGGCSRWISK
jgi:hypothetical protein